MKKFKVSFTMEISDWCIIQSPEEMLDKDQEDGMEAGFDISDVECELIGESNDNPEGD